MSLYMVIQLTFLYLRSLAQNVYGRLSLHLRISSSMPESRLPDDC